MKHRQDSMKRRRYQALCLSFPAFAFALAQAALPLQASAKIPNDPLVHQWAYEDTGVYRAWDIFTGSSDVVVAIIDNGFDHFHPDLRANTWRNRREIADNGQDDDQNGYIDDVYGWNFVDEDFNGDGVIDHLEQKGNNDPRPRVDNMTDDERAGLVYHHGSVIAGIIGAVGGNGRDGAGINWHVRLMNLRAVDKTGAGSIEDVIEAIEYAVKNGANVINVSIVGPEETGLTEAIRYAHQNGVVVVAAAGNDGVSLNSRPLYPVCSDANADENEVLGVSGITRTHGKASFSNFGSNCIDITAPSEDIASVLRYERSAGLSETFGGGWNGTSFAAPFVAGAAALVKGLQPSWKPAQIGEALLATVQHTNGQDERVYASLFGAGLLQVDKAIEYARERQKGRVEKLLFIDPVSGDVIEEHIFSGKRKAYRRLGFVGVDDALRLTTPDGAAYFALVGTFGSAQRFVKVYTDTWHLKSSWTIPQSGHVRLAVGNVKGDEQPEIIVSPYTSGNVLYDVYDMDGERLGGYEQEHGGVRVATVRLDETRSEIIVLSQKEGAPTLTRFDKFDRALGEFPVELFKGLGELGAGDIDGDGHDEYAITGSRADGPFVAYYEQSGDWTRKFRAYEAEAAGIDFGVVDFNGSGQADVLIHARGVKDKVNGWNNKSKVVASWAGFETPRDRIIVLGI